MDEKLDEEREEEGFFLSSRKARILHLRICFLTDDGSAQELHEATGAPLDACIEFMSHCMAAALVGDPPEIQDGD